MKRFPLVVALLWAGTAAMGQYTTRSEVELQSKKEVAEQTLVYQFEDRLLPDKAAREAKQAAVRRRKQQLAFMIDTASISDRQRTALRRDMAENPFSKRLAKFVQRMKALEETGMPTASAQK
ncbi:hypothetical protein ABV409_08805 [Flagellimonas sp. DF-77]|uniref:hypothetical protein n=1 Tax=Flagellimonas algarum TaxID=3230298 RepID=UPI003397B266